LKKSISKKRSRSRIKRILNEFRYYDNLLSETEDLFLDYDYELNEVLEDITRILDPNLSSKKSSETGLDNSDFKKKSSEDSSSPAELKEPENKKIANWMKKLFKKIAIETHPDKLSTREDLSFIEKIERESIYKKASAAIDKDDKFTLLESAILLEIDLDISEHEQSKIISEKIQDLKIAIEEHQKKVAWIWGENEGQVETRTNLLLYVRTCLSLPKVSYELIERYVIEFESGGNIEEFLKKITLDKKSKNSKTRKIGYHPGPRLSTLRKGKM
jgi:hypothetical protein